MTLGLPSAEDEPDFGSASLERVIVALSNLAYLDLSYSHLIPPMLVDVSAARRIEGSLELEVVSDLATFLRGERREGRLRETGATPDLRLLDLALAVGVLGAAGEVYPELLFGRVFAKGLTTLGEEIEMPPAAATRAVGDLPVPAFSYPGMEVLDAMRCERPASPMAAGAMGREAGQ